MPRRPTRFVPPAVLAFSLAVSSCGGLAESAGPRALAVMPGVINRTDNKSLRFALLKLGLESFCREMTKRGAPLKLVDDQPSIGRFYPRACDTRILDDDGANKSLLVQFLGSGYAWTNVTRRLAFDAAGVIEYDPDFLLDDGAMYLYFRTRHIAATSFQPTLVENGAAQAALLFTPSGFAESFGRQVVAEELKRGFTVIRRPDGSVDFGLGIVEKGRAPFHPFRVLGEPKLVLANERTEVHAEQRDFVGPFEVPSQGKALFLTAGVDGAPAIDVFVVPKDAGDQWLSLYLHGPSAAPVGFAPLMADVVTAGMRYRKVLPIAAGRYYVVLDNTATSGRVAPPPGLLDDRAALVDLAVEVGDAP